jgi:hypothetical protein
MGYHGSRATMRKFKYLLPEATITLEYTAQSSRSTRPLWLSFYCQGPHAFRGRWLPGPTFATNSHKDEASMQNKASAGEHCST